ncbi:MAG: hypothetical protein WC657_06150 [Candidatus Paceibacterota bacterium]
MQSLIEYHWIDENKTIHDWYDYAGHNIERNQRNAERARATRAARKQDVTPPSQPTDVPDKTDKPTRQTKKAPATADELIGLFTFEELQGLGKTFNGVDMEYQAGKCIDWWRENKRTMKSPKVAFKNWLEKAKPTLPVAQARPTLQTVKCELRNE